MSDFKTAYQQAFKAISPRQFNTATASSIKSARKTLIRDTAKFLKSAFKIKRPLAAIKDRLFNRGKPRATSEGITDKFNISNAQYSFLALPNKTRKRKLPKKSKSACCRPRRHLLAGSSSTLSLCFASSWKLWKL